MAVRQLRVNHSMCAMSSARAVLALGMGRQGLWRMAFGNMSKGYLVTVRTRSLEVSA